mmetsp:Transcript_4007/g.10049  ORF Transcript_4007/g.10049 Transcript_4007/m.10049 type:complete len:80 (-) Transcript_4007:158-397(-)
MGSTLRHVFPRRRLAVLVALALVWGIRRLALVSEVRLRVKQAYHHRVGIVLHRCCRILAMQAMSVIFGEAPEIPLHAFR